MASRSTGTEQADTGNDHNTKNQKMDIRLDPSPPRNLRELFKVYNHLIEKTIMSNQRKLVMLHLWEDYQSIDQKAGFKPTTTRP